MRSASRVAVGLLLVSPYLIWLLWISKWEWPATAEWLPVLTTASEQAAFSAAGSMIFGFCLFGAAQGWTSSRARGFAELALLLPNMVPPLFLVLSLLSWVTPWAAFPYGLGAVVVAHVLLNSGLVAVSIDRLVQSQLSGLAETAWTMGASRATFWRQVAWPVLKSDLACIFLFIFSLCLTSFSIPLVLGGARLATLEVAIFDFIRMEGRWDKAVILAALQSLLLLLLVWSLPHPFWPTQSARRGLPYLAFKNWRLAVYLPALILSLGWISGCGSIRRVLPAFDGSLSDALLTSLALGLTVGVLQLCLVLIVSYVLPHPPLNRFLNGYLAPSPAITGFAMLLLPGEGELFDFFKLAFALTLISFPLLYRWILHSALSGLQRQITVARTLGADWSNILFEVVWPQIAPQALRASGLAALWATGDFAISGIVAGQLQTVPLMMQDYLANYRIEAAQLLMFPLLIVGAVLYGLFVGASRYVTR